MGKGKGNFSHFIARVKTGSIIFELDTYQNSINPTGGGGSVSGLPLEGGLTGRPGPTGVGFLQKSTQAEDLLARQAFKVAASKLPLKLRFIKLDN
jgi:ribosomal protein L16/L10AE